MMKNKAAKSAPDLSMSDNPLKIKNQKEERGDEKEQKKEKLISLISLYYIEILTVRKVCLISHEQLL